MACKGHAISWSLSLLRVYRLEISSLQTRNFEFTNTKFQVFKLEVSSLQTWKFKFTNTKFWVYKHEILSLQTRNISSLNFVFVNSKQRNWSRNSMSLTSHRIYKPPYKSNHWALVTKMSCSRLLDRFQKCISVDGWKRSKNGTRTLVWMQIFCSVFIRWKRCVFKNALVWFRL